VEDTLMNNPVVIVLVIALVVAIGAAVWLFMRNRRSEQLQQRFGPEYERALETHHDQREAERELEARAERVEHLNIRPLEHDERERFASRWQSVQAQFVDDPASATEDADQLVGEVMATRGYPVGDFEQRAADVSVHHPGVVEHYRAAHAIAMRNARGDSDTEQLRQALMHYRALFDDLLETDTTARTEVRR
jgi:ABC-type nickel/cobalt efflux system permease component RcnA